MSTIAVNNITDEQGSGRPAFTNGIQTSNINGGQVGGRRNLIINGAMQVAQRGTSFTSGDYATDRFYGQNGAGSFEITQDNDAPNGFYNSLKIEVTSTGTPASNSANYFRQKIEGYNTSHLDFGSSSAKSITISFFVKSSISGQYSISVGNGAQDRFFPQSYIINSPNAWEYKTITIQGDTSGTWATDNTTGLSLYFGFGAGADRSEPSGSWTNNLAFGANGDTILSETNGATFQITGVQLEVGDTATEFEHRSYGEELALCQRYYYKIGPQSDDIPFGLCFVKSSSIVRPLIHFPTQMRAAPTAVESTGVPSDYMVYYGSDTTIVASGTPTIDITSPVSFLGGLEFPGSPFDVRDTPYLRSATSDAFLAWSAEL